MGKEAVFNDAQVAAHREASKLDWSHAETHMLRADGKKNPTPEAKAVESAYRAVQADIDAGRLELTIRDKKLIELANDFKRANAPNIDGAADRIKRDDNYIYNGEALKVLPLPQTPSDVEALANIRDRKAPAR